MSQSKSRQKGVILIFSLLMVLGISAIAVGMLMNARMSKSGGLNYKNRLQSFYAADGMMTLLAQEILDGRDSVYVAKPGNGILYADIWTGYNGGFSSYTNMVNYATAHPVPSKKDSTYYLGTKLNINNYLVKVKGYLHPPISGDYKLMVRADSLGALFLSSDDKPANLGSSPVAWARPAGATWPASSRWATSGTAISSPIYLSAGKRYYFEFYHADNGGNHFGDVGWSGPEFLMDQPILGQNLSAYGSAATKSDTVKLNSRYVQYQVMRSGLNIFGVSANGFRTVGNDTDFQVPLNQVLSMKGKAVAPPSSLKIPVIFYDYHSNGSNPEFEINAFQWNGKQGLVDNKIKKWSTENASYFGYTQLAKPTPSGIAEATCGVDRWFTQWKPGNFKRPRYQTIAGVTDWKDCTEITVWGNDKSYENQVFKDSLTLSLRADLGPSTYWYADTGVLAPEFFPLDNRGYYNVDPAKINPSGVKHNYSFCMEMHSQFQLYSGMSFEFQGDDDVWLFVNDSLVMDIGFIHGAMSGSVDFDKLPLRYGEIYSYDFFYCERRTWNSSLKIITNIPLSRPKGNPSRAWTRDYGNL